MTAEVAVEACDVIVVGGGTAAHEAAVSARQLGAERVVMLEKAPANQAGGNSRFTNTGFRFVHGGAGELRAFLPDVDAATFDRMLLPPYSRDDFMSDLMRTTLGRMDHALASVLVDRSNAALHWLRETGIRFSPTISRDVDGVLHFAPGAHLRVLGPRIGEQGGQYDQWQRILQPLGIHVRHESWATALHGSSRRIEGVRVSTPEREYDLEAPVVILCSGGFQADPEKRGRYLGPNADLMKVRGSRHDTGEVLMMALELGALAAGQWQGAHASPIDANAPAVEGDTGTVRHDRYSYPYGITVNALGERFFDEGEAEYNYTYAKTGRRILEQPGGVAYQIYDQGALRFMGGEYKDATRVQADTVAGLARSLGIEPVLLERTVAGFNAAVRQEVPFHPERRDGRSTAGLVPNKTNWANRIEQPPFVAVPVTGGITFTFGGLAVSGDAQVLNKAEQPIAGLYASGDILGLFFHNYPSYSGQTRNVVFSRLAARHGVRRHANL